MATSEPVEDGYRIAQGTLFASTTVTGMAAYFRGLDPTLITAAMVKHRIVDLAYRRPVQPAFPNATYPEKVVWHCQVNGGSCPSPPRKTSRLMGRLARMAR
ncbi:hypothetical protein BJX99DRAFT_227521 [Aspergillus californicus]